MQASFKQMYVLLLMATTTFISGCDNSQWYVFNIAVLSELICKALYLEHIYGTVEAYLHTFLISAQEKYQSSRHMGHETMWF